MRTRLFLFLLLCLVYVPRVSAELIIEENFEGTGYEEPWIEEIRPGSFIDPDNVDVPAPMYGATQLLKAASAFPGYSAMAIREFDSEEPVTYFRDYIRIGDEGLFPGTSMNLVVVRDGSDEIAYQIQLIKDLSGNLRFGWRSNDDDDFTVYESEIIGQHTTYLLEVKFDVSSETAEWRIDGTLQDRIEPSGIISGCKRFEIGATRNGFGRHLIVYHDRVAVDTQHYPTYSISRQILAPEEDTKKADWSPSEDAAAHVLLSDDSDETFVSANRASMGTKLELENPVHNGSPICVRNWARMGGIDEHAHYIALKYTVEGDDERADGGSTELPDGIRNYFTDSYENISTGLKWTWADLDQLMTVFFSGKERIRSPGGKISESWTEVYYGDSPEYPLLSHGPIFGGVSADTIKIGLRTSAAAASVKIRYGTIEADVRENKGDTGETNSQSTISEKDFSTIFTISGLTPDTRYFFDVVIDENPVSGLAETTGLRADPFWGIDLPQCKTALAEEADQSFRFAVIADKQVVRIQDRHWSDSVASKDPDFILHLGDWQTLHTDDITEVNESFRNSIGYQLPQTLFQGALLGKIPLFRIWSDHDSGGNNNNKIGTRDLKPIRNYNILDATMNYFPFPELGPGAIDGDLKGMVTNGDSNTLNDLQASFASEGIYPGMVIWNLTDDEYAVIQTVFDEHNMLTSDLSGGAAWDPDDEYRIKRGGLWYSFKWGDAEFFMLDTRYKRDPNGTANGDMLDGRQYSAGDGADGGGGVEAGHVQRDWLVEAVNGSTARWKFIGSEIPFKHDESQSADKWADHDPDKALYNYLKKNINAEQVIWLAGDRHFAALDDGSHVDDPWPLVLPGPAYRSGIHSASGKYVVEGMEAVYDAQINNDFMSFAIVEVMHGEVIVTIYDSEGNMLNNGLIDLKMTIQP